MPSFFVEYVCSLIKMHVDSCARLIAFKWIGFFIAFYDALLEFHFPSPHNLAIHKESGEGQARRPTGNLSIELTRCQSLHDGKKIESNQKAPVMAMGASSFCGKRA